MTLPLPRWTVAWALLLLLTACREEPTAIDRDVFIATYVDLRREALTRADGRIRPQQREEVLARHGVTEEDLLQFAEVHGRDVTFMAQVWSEVEAQLQPADSAGGGS